MKNKTNKGAPVAARPIPPSDAELRQLIDSINKEKDANKSFPENAKPMATDDDTPPFDPSDNSKPIEARAGKKATELSRSEAIQALRELMTLDMRPEFVRRNAALKAAIAALAEPVIYEYNTAEARGKVEIIRQDATGRGDFGPLFKISAPDGTVFTGFFDLYHLSGREPHCFQIVVDPVAASKTGEAFHARFTIDGHVETFSE